jgi:hypothetical protein
MVGIVPVIVGNKPARVEQYQPAPNPSSSSSTRSEKCGMPLLKTPD